MKHWISEKFFIVNHDYLDFVQKAQEFYFYLLNQYNEIEVKTIVGLGMKKNFECMNQEAEVFEHLKSMHLVLRLLNRLYRKLDKRTPLAKKLSDDISNGFKILVYHSNIQGFTIIDLKEKTPK